jgi:hypothetical protein
MGIKQVLSKKILNSSYFIIDGWSALHLIGGTILMYLIVNSHWFSQFNYYYPLFVIVISWEVFEYIKGMGGKFNNIFSDIVFGMLGGFLYLKFIN